MDSDQVLFKVPQICWLELNHKTFFFFFNPRPPKVKWVPVFPSNHLSNAVAPDHCVMRGMEIKAELWGSGHSCCSPERRDQDPSLRWSWLLSFPLVLHLPPDRCRSSYYSLPGRPVWIQSNPWGAPHPAFDCPFCSLFCTMLWAKDSK